MSARGRRISRLSLRDERGFLLIEVVISAALLLTISLAAMSALDRSDQLAGDQQKRTIGANVAQAELERVRSLPISDVANLRAGGSGDSTKTLNGVPYKISTATKWLSDGRDTVDCTTAGGGLDYLQATTTVTWPSMSVKPVKMSTLIAPSTRSSASDEGSLSVQITSADGTGLANLPVTLTGPTSFPVETTDANGCVAWGSLDATQPWHLKFQKAGYVDADGTNAVDDVITLTGGATTQSTYLYDQAGTLKVLFKTRATTGVDIASPQTALYIANGQMTNDKNPTFASNSTWDGAATPLFPFNPGPYTLYPGTCPSALPPSTNIDILQAPRTASVTSGLQQVVTVWTPSLDVSVVNGSGVPISGATVKITDACGVTYTRTTNGAGHVNEGFPYFKYNAAAPNPASTGGSLCVSSGGRRFTFPAAPATTPRLSNADFSKATPVNVSITGSSPFGSC